METLNILTGEVETKLWPDQYHIPIFEIGETGDPRSITETAYIPPTQQIKDMMAAGLRLAEERRARFDSVQLNIREEEDIPFDPTREPGVDLVDIQRATQRVQANLKEAARLARDAAAAAIAAANTPPVVPPDKGGTK